MVLNRFRALLTANQATLASMQKDIDDLKLLAAKQLLIDMKRNATNLRDSEFKVFSQFGDDGIIQFLIEKVQPRKQEFVEFGVSNYVESNTRFLLLNNNWRGLIIDRSAENIQFVRSQELYWRHDLTAVSAFITRDNINSLIADANLVGEIGLLSIDVDGTDYWIWESINCVEPAIVVCEYNSLFGANRAVTVDYQPNFDRTEAHYSNLYWGCSLKALCLLAKLKKYSFVGCNSHGNNAYFVKNSLLAGLPQLTCDEGFVESKFRESRDEKGNLTFASRDMRQQLIASMPLVDLETHSEIKVGDLFSNAAKRI